MIKIETLKNQLKGLSTEFALTWMLQKGVNQKTFFWDGEQWTVERAKKQWEKALQEMKCSELGILRFYGGPPGKADWYDGTVLSMVCDMILFAENTVGLTENEKLGI
jgi:hypothetical protein